MVSAREADALSTTPPQTSKDLEEYAEGTASQLQFLQVQAVSTQHAIRPFRYISSACCPLTVLLLLTDWLLIPAGRCSAKLQQLQAPMWTMQHRIWARQSA